MDNEEPVTAPAAPQDTRHPDPGRPPLRTRTGWAWVTVCLAVLVGIALLVFIAQNTQEVEVSFLWLDGTTSLAVMMLIAAVCGSVVTAILGTARILQLRRAVRHR
jgi:lipopolysaccharide assembly protein A